MRLGRAFTMIAALILCAGGVIGWSLFHPQTSARYALDQAMPEGALLYIEAKDFSALLGDWRRSPEHAEWIKSDDHRVFSNSRLFLRLGQASDQFAAAAGIPPDMDFLTAAAGGESAVAVYDIGNLELLYVSRLPAGRFVQSQLWQLRSRFQPRSAAGRPFYARKDEPSGRVVAFAVMDDYLVLGTREDLVAGALALMSGGKARSLRQEGWYAQALAAAASAPGDLRMVMNMEKIAVTPHFRTYWVQRNITEMQGYGSAISDLYREGNVYREERAIVPKKPAGEAEIMRSAQAVSGLLGSVPREAGFYQAAPAGAKQAAALLQQKILAPQFSAGEEMRLAPQAQLTSGVAGSSADLETRIDLEPASRAAGENPLEQLEKELAKAGPSAALVVHRSRRNEDGVLLSLPAVVAIAADGNWNLAAIQEAAQRMAAPGVTVANMGVQWREVKDGGYFEMDGLQPVQMAVRGKVLYFSNDAPLLLAVLGAKGAAPVPPAIFAAGFHHAKERQDFYRLSGLMDQGARATDRQPQFFSQNIASLSRALSRVESEEIVTRAAKDKIQQRVTYRWAP